MRIISIANQKGGCGKTTTAINLSACLASMDRNVLLIDMDPQGHSALGLNLNCNRLERTVSEALLNPGEVPLSKVIIEVGEKLYVAPSGITLSAFEHQVSMVQGREAKLKQLIEGLDQIYDYVMIDCPPSLGLLTFNSLMASSEVFIPIETGFFSLYGTGQLLEIIDLVRKKTGHEIRVKVIPTMCDERTRIARETLQDIRNNFEDSMFKSLIHSNVKLKEAASFGKSIVDYDRKSKGYSDYMALAREVISEERIIGIVRSEDQQRQLSEPDKIEKRFVFDAPEAKSVKIVGDFNDWMSYDAYLMERREDGSWSKTLLLEPGEYQYKFVVDDTWVEDQNNPKVVDNPFGGKNSIIEVQ